MKKVYIVEAKRSPIGKFLGTLKDTNAGDLGGAVLKEMLKDHQELVAEVDEVIIGNVLSAGLKQGIARQVSLNAGFPVETPAYSLNMVCGSGMKAVMNGLAGIQSGSANLVVAGGVELMSAAPFLLSGKNRTGSKLGNLAAVDSLIGDGLTDVFNNYHMGITAENIAAKHGISREEQDAFSYESQKRAIAAVDSGRFDDEIVPILIKKRKEEFWFGADEHMNRTTNEEKLARLRPAFKKDGTVTAGNASGINDGASMTLLASEEAVDQYWLNPLVEIVAVGQGGVDPSVMGLGPVPAIRNVLKNAKMSLADIELIELNEAFAAQSLGVLKELSEEHGVRVDHLLPITNVNGGAIALGHPLGASGNRILVTLIHEMKKRKLEYGLASLCIGGGMGTAIIVKNVE
ncbi:acetyl-CoA C-acetyltransferase [Gottschalkiaceae bacterium SANA]|nr:acetyl-CoA C-acetyltransferase [Gottschalkiaceae bacterium SANA]